MIDSRVLDTIASDVITSSTPLEMQLAGVHPRLHVTADRLAAIRDRLGERVYAYMLASLKRTVEAMANETLLAEGDNGQPIKMANFQASGVDKRGYGDRIHQAAGYFLLTGDTQARDLAVATMHGIAAYKDWGSSLTYGHWAHGMACGLDWLWDELPADEREVLVDVLLERTQHVFGEWSSYRSGEPFGYTWNIMGVILGGLSAAAGVLYGERPHAAPFVNLVTEKARTSSNALGHDGVSPEGLAYGGYYFRFMTCAFTIIRDLVGVDLFQSCEWYRNVPEAIYYHWLPRGAWGNSSRCFQFGDAHRDNSCGYSSGLLACARAYGDELAQWLADEEATIVPGHEGGDALSIFWFDPDVKPVAPRGLPTLKHFSDMEIVLGRSDWSGDESAYGVKCGPPNGHKGMTQFANPLAGGHMHPSSGTLLAFGHGQWLVAHPGYTWKDTSYHNCLLIDGQGQQGSNSEWFEDLSYRQGAPTPHILEARSTDWGDYVLANPGPAYWPECGVEQYYRHVFFVKPDCWVVVDAVRLKSPAVVEALWHTLTPLTETEPGVFEATHDTAYMRISTLLADGLSTSTEEQTILHSSRYTIDPMQLLRIKTDEPVKERVLVSVIESAAAGDRPQTTVTCAQTDAGLVVDVTGLKPVKLTFDPFGAWRD